MQIDFTINKNRSIHPQKAKCGNKGDNIATKLVFNLPQNLEDKQMRLKFKHFHEVWDIPVKSAIDLPFELTQFSILDMQAVFYDQKGEYVGNTNKVCLEFSESIDSTGVIIPPAHKNEFVELRGKAVTDGKNDGAEIVFYNIENKEVFRVKEGAGGSGEGSGPFRRSFLETEWEPYLVDYRLIIPATEHLKGSGAAVIETLRDDPLYFEGVQISHVSYVNGDVALISNNPFSGKVSII